MKTNILLFLMALLPMAAMAQNDSTEIVQDRASAFNDSIIHALPELTVTGEKPVVKADGGKLVFDIGKLIKDKPADNAFEALKHVLGVTPQGDDITLGGMPVSLMIDGKLTSMTRQQVIALLKSTPASRVVNAEVMYAAPARYQVRGALINVVLGKEKAKDLSLQGELFGKVDVRHNAHFNERASLIMSKGKWSADAFYNITHGKGFYKMDKDGVHTLDDGTRHEVNTRERINKADRPVHEYRIGTDLDFAKSHRLSVSYSGSYEDGRQHNDMSGMQTSTVHNDIKNILHNGHVDYLLPIGLNAGADITYYESSMSQNLGSELEGVRMDFVSDSQQRINRSKLFAKEEHAIGKAAKVNYGIVYTHIIDHSRQVYTPQGGTTAEQLPQPLRSRRTENTLNIYAGAGAQLGSRVSAEVSLAAEHSKTSLWDEWDFYPTLTATYTPAQGHTWQLAFSSDKTYPDFWAVQNATSYHGGQYEQIVGNPDLKPSKEYSVSLLHILHGKYIFRGWFSHAKDYSMQTMFQSRGQLVEIDKFNNFDFQQQAGLMIAAPWSPAWWLNSRANLFGIWMREKDSDYFDCPFDRNIAYAMISANATFRFVRSRDLSLTVSAFARTKAYQGTLDLPSSGNLDLNLRYAFAHGNAVVNLYCNDIFQTMMITPECRWAGQNLRTTFSCYRTVGLSFTYKFGGYKEKKREKVDMERLKK